MLVNSLNPTILCGTALLGCAVMLAIAPQAQNTSEPPKVQKAEEAKPQATPPVAAPPVAERAAGATASQLPEVEFSKLLEAFICDHDVEVLPDGTIITRVAHPIRPTVTREIPIETVRAAIEVAKEIDPALAERLAALCNKDSRECEQKLRLSGQRLLALAELKVRDPQLYKVKLGELQHELQVQKLTAAYRRAVAAGDSTQAEELLQDLRAAVQVQLAWSVKARGDYICRLEEQIQRAKDELTRDALRFQKTVDDRLIELTKVAPAKSEPQAPVATKAPADAKSTTPEPAPPPQPIPAAPR